MKLAALRLTTVLVILGATQVQAQYSVSNTAGDSSAGSLGSALQQSANAVAYSTNTVSFVQPPFNSAQTITLSGSYSPVTKDSSEGGVILSAPTLLTINDGGYTIFSFSGGNGFSLGNLSLNGTGTGLKLGGNTSVMLDNVTVADGVNVGGSYVGVAAGTTSTFSGPVSGSSGLTEVGTGTLVLSGTNNSYTGGTGVGHGGTVSISNDANLGSTVSGGIGLDNGTLLTTSGITTSRAVSLGSGGGTIAVAAGQTSTFNGQFTGTGALTVAGAGTVVLGNTNNALSNGVSIQGSTLSVASGAAWAPRT